MTTGIRSPGQVTIDKIGEHLDDLHAGELESAAFQNTPAFKKVKAGTNPESAGNYGAGGGGGGAMGYPMPPPSGGGSIGRGASMTLSLFSSLQDPANGAVLGNCMMALLQDALDNQIASHKQQVMAAMSQIGVAMSQYASTLKDVADTRHDAQEKESADMTAAWVSIGAGVAQAACAFIPGASGLGTALGTIAGGIGRFEEAEKDEIDANSGTLADKVQMAQLTVLQKIADADEASKKSNLDDSTDHLHNMRDMLGKIWQSKVDNMNAAQIHK